MIARYSLRSVTKMGVAVGALALLTGCDRSGGDDTPQALTSPAAVGEATAGAPATLVAGSPMSLVTETPLSSAALTATEQAAARYPEYLRSIGTPGEQPGELRLPFDVAVTDAGNLWVADSKGVQQLDAEGNLIVQIDQEVLRQAHSVDTASDGTVYVTGFGAQILVFGPDGSPQGTIGEAGSGEGALTDPQGITVDAADNIYVADAGDGTVEKFANDGTHMMTIGGPGSQRGQFRVPWSVAVDDAGHIYVSTADDYLIQHFDPEGTYVDAFGQSHADENLWQTAGLSIGPNNRLFALQVPYNRVQVFDLQSAPATFMYEFGTLGSGPLEFSTPRGADISGDMLYVADSANDRIQVLRIRE